MNPTIVMSSNSKADKDQDVDFAINGGFHGVDWSFDMDRLPLDNESRSRFLSQIRKLHENRIEVRFHAPLFNVEIGHRNDHTARRAMDIHLKILELIAEAGGEFLTLHIGLGDVPDKDICLLRVEENLRALKTFGCNRGITICLENLIHGPTSIPEQWLEILKVVNISATFDLGHAKGCDSVVKDLWTPIEIISHVSDRLIHAHIYKEENGQGHVSPETIHDLGIDLLDTLMETSCQWWVIELPKKEEALQTREILVNYIQTKNNF